MSRRDRRTLDLGGAALGLQASLTVFSKLVMGDSARGDEDDAGRCVQDEEHDEQRAGPELRRSAGVARNGLTAAANPAHRGRPDGRKAAAALHQREALSARASGEAAGEENG